jgi:hypothetical protein
MIASHGRADCRRIEKQTREVPNMEHSTVNHKANVIAIALGTLGTLFFISIGFNLMPFKYAAFAGIACYILAGSVRRLMMKRY